MFGCARVYILTSSQKLEEHNEDYENYALWLEL